MPPTGNNLASGHTAEQEHRTRTPDSTQHVEQFLKMFGRLHTSFDLLDQHLWRLGISWCKMQVEFGDSPSWEVSILLGPTYIPWSPSSTVEQHIGQVPIGWVTLGRKRGKKKTSGTQCPFLPLWTRLVQDEHGECIPSGAQKHAEKQVHKKLGRNAIFA